MTPELIPESRSTPLRRKAPAGTAVQLPPEREAHAPGIMLVIVALVAALTAFFAGLKDVSAGPASAAPGHYSQDEIEAAQGMEAMMASMLIEQMRKSVPDSEFMPKSSGERIFESLLDYEYAQTMSRAGTLGLSDLVLAEMRRNR